MQVQSGPASSIGGPTKCARRKRRIALRTWAKLILALTVVLSAATLLLFLSYSLRFPDPLSLARKQQAPLIQILARDGSELATRGSAASYMPLDMLPAHVADAVIATEDRRFFQHWGIDPWGLIRAAAANLRAGRFAQGGSTLTQQLAKNLFLTGERTLWRKGEELTFAIWLELRLGKRDILELYLNRVYFGGGAHGVEAASRRYFAKSARDLNVAESAVLAGLLKAPSKYSPAASIAAARARSRVVIAAMLASGHLAPAAANAALDHPVVFDVGAARGLTGLEYAVEYALERMPPIRGQASAGIIVETTIDPRIQKRAHEAVTRALDAHGAVLQASQAGVVVLDTSGGIRALTGGRSYVESQFNRAVKARRQPGSAFKPMVYLAAIESGLTPDSPAYDLPLSVQGWSPRNDNGAYQGEMTLRQALASSVNTVAVRLYLDLAKGRVIDTARRLGIASHLNDAPALALGASEVTLLELTGAYAVFPAGGLAVEPHIVERVRMADGPAENRVLYQRVAPKPMSLVAKPHVEAMNDMLSEVMLTGTGKRAAIAGHQAAGKTGTSQDFRDAWFIGYTAQLTAGVWVGNDSGRPMHRVMGGSLPARIWQSVMTAALEAEPPVPLPGARTAPGTTATVTPKLPAPVAVAKPAPPLPTPKAPIAVPQAPAKSGSIVVLPPPAAPVTAEAPRPPPDGMMSLGAGMKR